MNLEKLLIPAEEGFKEWVNKQAHKNMGRGINTQRLIQKAINSNSDDPLRTMTPVKIINAVYRALNARGEKFIRDKKQNVYLVRDCVVTPGLKLGGHYTVQGAAFVIMGKTNILHQNGLDVREIRYFTESGEKTLNRTQITQLITGNDAGLESYLIPATEAYELPNGATISGLIQYLLDSKKMLSDSRASNKLYMSLKGTDLKTYAGVLASGKSVNLSSGKQPIVALIKFTGHTTFTILKYVTEGKNQTPVITSLRQKDYENYLNSLK